MDDLHKVTIEQRLDEPGRFLIFGFDDAMCFLVPAMIGFLARALIEGAICGLIVYFIWRKLKGESGIARLKAAVYWYAPFQASPFRAFPPSHVIFWRG